MQRTGQVGLAQVAMSGLAAGLAQTLSAYLLSRFIFAGERSFTGFVASSLNIGGSADTGVSLTGLTALLAAAIGWALLYRAVSPRRDPWTGMLFGLGIWTLGVFVILPLLGAVANLPTGFLGTAFGGWNGVLVALSAHLAYGVVLGALLRTD